MNIYIPIEITQKIRDSFVPCRLYIKELVGVKYFGKTTCLEIDHYYGSGVIWKNRIKKYGRQNIKTLWVSDWYNDPDTIQEVALSFSKENDIVNSKLWANIKPENGLDGGSIKGINLGRKKSKLEKEKISKSKKGKKINRTAKMPEYAKNHLSNINKGKVIPKHVIEKILKTKIKNGTLNHSEESKKKMRKPKSPQAIENMKKSKNPRASGGIWVNNGIETKWTREPIQEGWRQGRLEKPIPPSQKNKIWINNGVTSKMSFVIPNGWVKGRLKKSKI